MGTAVGENREGRQIAAVIEQGVQLERGPSFSGTSPTDTARDTR